MATTCTVILSFRTENELVFLFYRALHKWWAQYMESTGDMENALQYYENAQDYLSLVRVYCYCGQMDKVGFLLFPTLPVTDQLVIHTYNSLFWSEYMSLLFFFFYTFQAAEICNNTGDRAACYHLGRQYENQDQIKEAIHFFTRAQAYFNAIRLCKVSPLFWVYSFYISNLYLCVYYFLHWKKNITMCIQKILVIC